MAEITVIPAAEKCGEIIRTAAYARVSSDSADQLNSFTAQIRYYSELLKSSSDAVLVDIYADEGISGTGSEKRDEFQRLMRDCRKGKIDRILTKSVSRFARNTKDCLEAVRELKSIGISVYFEKENIDTAEINSEMLLTMHSVFAQEESLSISKNCRMGAHKRMADGTYKNGSVPYGYDYIDGQMKINSEKAEIVKQIFNMYLQGLGVTEIADYLNEHNVAVKKYAQKWKQLAILQILGNEKYVGDTLFQKRFASDTLPFTLVKNNGEKPQYYVKSTHEAIISREIYETVQKMMFERKLSDEAKIRHAYPFRKKLYCGNCGYFYRRKVRSNGIHWVCKNHDDNKDNCCSKGIPETEIYSAFIRLQNKLAANCKDILIPMLRQLQELADKGISGNAQIAEIRKEIAEVKNQRHLMAELKSQGILDAAYYTEHSSQLDRKLLSLQNQLHSLMGNDEDDEEIDGIKLLISFFENAEPITEFDEILFGQVVEKIIVRSSTELTFRLAGGVEFTEKIRRKERRGK